MHIIKQQNGKNYPKFPCGYDLNYTQSYQVPFLSITYPAIRYPPNALFGFEKSSTISLISPHYKFSILNPATHKPNRPFPNLYVTSRFEIYMDAMLRLLS
jgi:hypothetical protein